MILNLKQKTILKALVHKELKDIEKLDENEFVVNSPVLSTIYRMKETDLQFIKTKKEYKLFLENLISKL